MHNLCATTYVDSLRGSSVNIGTVQRVLAWPLRKDDTRKLRSVNDYCYTCNKHVSATAARRAHSLARLAALRGATAARDGYGSIVWYGMVLHDITKYSII